MARREPLYGGNYTPAEIEERRAERLKRSREYFAAKQKKSSRRGSRTPHPVE